MNESRMLSEAVKIALKKKDRRAHKLGAIGIRSDGAVVTACNGPAERQLPSAHAEARLARKLSSGSTVIVARANSFGNWLMARPCNRCLKLLKNKFVRRVIYTIKDGEYGVIRP
jgi:tRNA(Arg) A34 adenosine deaminase TadA